MKLRPLEHARAIGGNVREARKFAQALLAACGDTEAAAYIQGLILPTKAETKTARVVLLKGDGIWVETSKIPTGPEPKIVTSLAAKLETRRATIQPHLL